jgi:hypothetical protein
MPPGFVRKTLGEMLPGLFLRGGFRLLAGRTERTQGMGMMALGFWHAGYVSSGAHATPHHDAIHASPHADARAIASRASPLGHPTRVHAATGIHMSTSPDHASRPGRSNAPCLRR